jgi:hypothetical protein
MGQELRPRITRPRLARKYLLLIVGIFLLMHIFMFRNLLVQAPAMASGNASIVREELVPFFNYHTQYIPKNNSKLTGSNEFRVVYAYWTSWTRQNAILPYMLVIVNTLSATILFYAFYRIARNYEFVDHLPRAAFLSFIAALVIHLLLLYSKIAHFYTLILGFSMYALAMTYVFEQFFFLKRLRWRNVGIAGLLVLLNPAIHYHVIFYLTLGIALLIQAVFLLVMNTEDKLRILLKNISTGVIVGLLSLIPYLAYLKLALPSATDAFAQAPVDYWSIYYSSVPLTYLFSLDGLGHVDLYRHGNYLAPSPRIFILLIFAVIPISFLLKYHQQYGEHRKMFLTSLLAFILAAVWMSIGYSTPGIFTFHKFLGDVSAFFAEQTGAVAHMLVTITGMFINVLRYPHRFELLFYYVGGVMLAISFIRLYGFMREKNLKTRTCIAIICALVILPFAISTDYGRFRWVPGAV